MKFYKSKTIKKCKKIKKFKVSNVMMKNRFKYWNQLTYCIMHCGNAGWCEWFTIWWSAYVHFNENSNVGVQNSLIEKYVCRPPKNGTIEIFKHVYNISRDLFIDHWYFYSYFHVSILQSLYFFLHGVNNTQMPQACCIFINLLFQKKNMT